MAIKHIVWIVALVAACHRDSAPPPPALGSAVGADPWIAKDAAPETPETRQARANQALGRVAEIMPKLAKIRELTFEHDIPREYQTTADFRAFVHAEIAKELPPDKSADTSTALFQLGLLKKPANLAQLEEQAFVTQAGAYYDPKQKKFFLVMVPDNDIMLDTMSAHELTHGLQDQHFDLEKFLPDEGDGKAPKLDDDASAARRFVAEGDATFTMFLYMAAQVTNATSIDPKMIALLEDQLGKLAAMSPEEMAKANAPASSSSDPEIKKSIDAMADIPATVLVPLVDSYTQGALLVVAAYKRGGWKAVDDLYAHPPESTEQALHPDKLFGTRDRPHHVKLPALPGTTELVSVVLGELQWQVYFGLWVPQVKIAASEGWGGDIAAVARRTRDGRLITRIATVWDTPGDANEFVHAYKDSLIGRFRGDKGDPSSASGATRPDGGGKIFMRQDGARVFIVDGVDSARDLDTLAAGATFD